MVCAGADITCSSVILESVVLAAAEFCPELFDVCFMESQVSEVFCPCFLSRTPVERLFCYVLFVLNIKYQYLDITYIIILTNY